jgi:hypothetical protein
LIIDWAKVLVALEAALVAASLDVSISNVSLAAYRSGEGRLAVIG